MSKKRKFKELDEDQDGYQYEDNHNHNNSNNNNSNNKPRNVCIFSCFIFYVKYETNLSYKTINN